MRKSTILAIILVIWLALDVFHIQEALLTFLIIGEIPYTDTVLSPTLFLAIMTVATAYGIAKILTSHDKAQSAGRAIKSHAHLPKRRYHRV